ncbi:MAG TPA: HAD-IA family hydrolase [Dehalococcoidia bacterium]|nr:HAD-IA family hydrolase [Dehalococcoidia bacterium]
MTRLRAVLFDLHGTLIFSTRVFTREDYAAHLAERATPLVRAWGVDLDLRALCRDLMGAIEAAWEIGMSEGRNVDCPFIVRGAFADRGVEITDAQARLFWNAGRLPFADYAQLFPDTTDVLRALRDAGLRLALVTNQPYPGDLLLPDLEAFRLRQWFDAILVSHDVGHSKPHPVIFARALDALGASPAEAIMVGDTPEIDVRGAKRVGMRAVLKRNGDRRRTMQGADYAIDDLVELLELPCMPPGLAAARLAPTPTPHEDDNEGRY